MNRHLIQKILALCLLVGMVLSEICPVSVYAGEINESSSTEIENIVKTEVSSEEETVTETVMKVQEEAAVLEMEEQETQSLEIVETEKIQDAQEMEESVIVQTITGFVDLTDEEKRIEVSYSNKPELSELMAMMPGSLEVYLDGADTATAIEVEWFCVTGDYDVSDVHYFQFSPAFDETKYRLADSIDLVTSGPYVGVFLEVSVESTAKTLNAADVEENKKKIFNALTQDMDMNSAAACGVLANIECESGFDPEATGDSGSSYGLCQWHDSRKENLIDYCEENGYDYTTVEGQMKFLEYELNSSEYRYIYDYMLSEIDNTADGAYEAGAYWCKQFERPADAENVSAIRGNLARDTYWPEFGIETELTIPVLSDISNAVSGVTVTWGTVSGASGYYVYRRTSSNESWVLVGTVSGGSIVSYTDTNVTSGTTYYYAVSAYSGDGDDFDQYVTTEDVNYRTGPGTSYEVAGTLAKGTTVRVVPGYSTEADGYTWYKIYYAGQYYYLASKYLEKSSDASGDTSTKETEKSSEKSILYLSSPVLKSASNAANGVCVSWEKVTGATAYYVYRKEEGGKYSLTGKISGGSVLNYTDNTAESGKAYVYTVRAGNGKTLSSFNSTSSILWLTTPILTEASNAKGGLKVSWKKVTGATVYYVYRKEEGGKYSLTGKISGGNTLTYTDDTAESGKTYIYTVRAGNGKTLSYFDSTKTALCLAIPGLSGAEGVDGGIKVTWNKINAASGYYIYRKNGDGKWARIGSVSSGSTVSYTDTSAVGGTTYIYTVRAYKGSTLSWFVESGISGKFSHTLIKYVTTAGVNYRTGPGTSYSVAGTLSKGTEVQVVSGYSAKADGYTWYKIYLNGKYYYVSSSYLKKV